MLEKLEGIETEGKDMLRVSLDEKDELYINSIAEEIMSDIE